MTSSRRASLLRIALAALSGAMLFLSAPPFKWWPLCFVAALALAASIRGQGAPRSFALGLVGAFFYWIFAAPWLVGTITRFTPLKTPVAVVLFLLFCVGQSLMIAVQCALSSAARPVLGATLATALSALASERYVAAVFAWQFAAPLVEAPWIPQVADVLTCSGVSALLHAWAIAVVTAVHEKRAGALSRGARRAAYAACAAMAVATIYGAVRTAQFSKHEDRPTVRVALLQPAVPPLVRWDERAASSILAALHAQTREAIARDPELIVWHEGAYPYVLPHQAGVDGVFGPPVYPVREAPPIVFGLMSAGPGAIRYNGVFLRNEDGTLSAPVAKRALVPFGESVPLASTIPWLARVFSQSGGISPGPGTPLLRTRSGLLLGVLICFEDTLAHAAADVADGALIVNLTNDGWFESPTALEEHLLMARWRSIELRRETVRAVNTGVSGRIDVLGRMAARGPVNRAMVLHVTARTYDTRTLAPLVARWGGLSCFVALGAALALRAQRQRRERDHAAPRRSIETTEDPR